MQQGCDTMPKRDDLKTILIIGSGPIVIGQACEFDYSGSQACKALKEEGYRIVLVNSNPATIMTDPVMADATYVEPLTSEVVKKVIEREKPDAVIPGLGGQTGLNLVVFLHQEGFLEQHGVEVLGTVPESISRAEDRGLFRQAMQEIGVQVPASDIACSVEEAERIAEEIGFPLILRPAYTLGGSGGGVAYNAEELAGAAASAIAASPVGQVLVEQSVLGWKEIEFEVVRDSRDSVIIVASMENVDPAGVHTGDSIVVAPALTLSSREYVHLVGLCKKVIRKIDVKAGGANIQWVVHPETGEVCIIEVNPRLSRSSALASKATGYPIAWVSAKLAAGYTLDEIINPITGSTTCFFEPALDYCILKIPRFNFEKFPHADATLTTSMKAVGEVMAIGSNFKEALQKGLRSMETGRAGLGADGRDPELRKLTRQEIAEKLGVPNDQRLFYIRYAFQKGFSLEQVYELTKIDRWFLSNIQDILQLEEQLADFTRPELDQALTSLPGDLLWQAKEAGFSDLQLAQLLNCTEQALYAWRKQQGLTASYKEVDTCAGEVYAQRPYFYSTYGGQDENRATSKKKVMVLGGGPNRIGQGIEFDYCCVHASYALQEEGYESIMVNSNPETVSTDYDTSTRLYFEPLTREDVLGIIDKEQPDGVVIQFGGQTPLNLALSLEESGVPIIGTNPDSIDRAEDRKRFDALLQKLDLVRPESGTALSPEEVRAVASGLGYPVMVRPSYVLGGRAMQICFSEGELEDYMTNVAEASYDHPVLVEKLLEDAVEVDVDAVCDGETVLIGGIMEHIEEAGIHSGDSACVLPVYSLMDDIVEKIKEYTRALALELDVRGLMNVQYAVRNDIIYVLEVNPRASRTVPFVSKAVNVPLVKLATRAMLGQRLKDMGFRDEIEVPHMAVKEAVFPFNRFPGVDAVLGPEMRSTGEVMGIDYGFGMAYAKSQLAAGQVLPSTGNVFLSVRNQDKRSVVFLAKRLVDLGFSIVSTRGTARILKQNDIQIREIPKLHEGRPNVIDLIKNGEIQLMIITSSGGMASKDQRSIRSFAVTRNVPLITTLSGAQASINGIEALHKRGLEVKSLQEYGEYLL